jgi:hypothetical protein
MVDVRVVTNPESPRRRARRARRARGALAARGTSFKNVGPSLARPAAMADLERSRTDFERKALAVGAALRQLQQDVADAPVTAAREELGAELRKRRRLSGAVAPPAGQLPDWHVDIDEEQRPFNEAAEKADDKLQGLSHAMARVHGTVQQVRATVVAVKVEAAPLLERLAAAREARNGSCSALLEMLGWLDDVALLGELSVATLWRLRGCRGRSAAGAGRRWRRCRGW